MSFFANMLNKQPNAGGTPNGGGAAKPVPVGGSQSLENTGGNNNGQPAGNNGGGSGADVQDNQPAPLEAYKTLWENDPNDKGAQPASVLPAITAETLSKTLANSDFMSNIDPQLRAKAASGDVQAFNDVINAGLRNVMTQSVLASHGLVNAGARAYGDQFSKTLPNMIRSNNASETLASNPLYKNPAVRNMMDNTREQFERKFPNASAREIAEMTDNYFSEVSAAFTGRKQEADDAANGGRDTSNGEIDWFETLGLPKM